MMGKSRANIDTEERIKRQSTWSGHKKEWVSPKGNYVNSQDLRPMGMSLLVLLEREEEESRLIYPRSLGCDRLVPQPLSKGRGGFYSVGASGMNRLSAPW